jgi:enoyl-CoA hydratase
VTTVTTEVHGGVAVLTLNDPDHRNVLRADLVDDLVSAYDWIEGQPEIGAVVLTGAGKAFCAGADLSDLGEAREAGLRHIYEGFLRVGRSPLPTIAAVNGPAVGAGMNLALVCDIRIAATSARFDTRFLQLGIHPGGGHTWMLQRIVGPQATAAMVLFGEILDGAGAERTGLAWACVPDDDLLATCLHLAGRAAAAPRDLVRETKQTLADVSGLDLHDDAVERELRTQLWSMDQPEFAELLAKMKRRVTGT